MKSTGSLVLDLIVLKYVIKVKEMPVSNNI